MIDVMTIIIILILIYIVYNFMYCSNNKNNYVSGESVVPKRNITNLEEELRKQYEDNSENRIINNTENNNLDNNKNNKSELNYDDLNDKMIKDKNGILFGVVDKNSDSGKESLPENIQGIKMVQENKKSNFMMDKNMPYIDLENDMINLSLLPELRT